MNIKFIITYGIVTLLVWNAEEAQPVLLTSTLITGLMGGYLIGRTPLGTFLGALTNNASLPSLPSVTSFLPSLPTFTPKQEETPKTTTENVIIKPVAPTTPAPPVYIYPTYAYPTYPTQPPAPSFSYPNYNSLPNPFSYAGNGIYTYNMFTTTTTTAAPKPSDSNLDLSYISPVDVPVSLDNKIRERFIRQLAMIDPLNCLPKTFCEVTSDPYRAAMALDKGSILGLSSIHGPTITKEELIAYESQLPIQRPPLPSHKNPPPPLPPSTTTTSPPPKESEKEEEEEDDISHSGSDEDNEHDNDHLEDDTDSGSHSEENSEEDDETFELYRKEHEHKLEMQALDEMIDEIEDPQTYMYILRDKQKRKNARRKFREKHRENKNGGFPPGGNTAFRQDSLMDEIMLNQDQGTGYYSHEEPAMTMPMSRRTGSEIQPEYHFPPVPPMQPMPPPRPPQPSFLRRPTTEAPIKDMFADDPFFDDVSGRSGRKLKARNKNAGKSHRRNKRDLVGDPLTQYRLAYIVAEKYKNPNLCNVAFPSCPYQTKTIMSVVNRLESGILPLGKAQVNRYRDKENRNNLEQFRNTLVAIERLNKATMDARARGEPIDIEEMTEVASNPTSNFETNTSQDIVNEFQRVVAKIQTAHFTKRRLQLEKAKPLNGDRPPTNYDAVHYYKKAQMDELKPKERLKTGILETKSNVKQQDDEAQNKRYVPTFRETYREMFKKGVKKENKNSKKSAGAKKVLSTNSQGNPSTSSIRSKQKDSKRKSLRRKPKPEGIKRKSSETPDSGEDDERDAQNEQEAVDAMIMITQRSRRAERSRIV